MVVTRHIKSYDCLRILLAENSQIKTIDKNIILNLEIKTGFWVCKMVIIYEKPDIYIKSTVQ